MPKGRRMGYSFLLDPRFRGDDRLDDNIAFLTVLGSMLRIFAIFLYDMPNKCNSVAFWVNFCYK